MEVFLNNLVKEIQLSGSVYRLALPHIESGRAKILADKIQSNGCLFCSAEYKKSPKEFAPLLLAASLLLAEKVYKKYRERNIPDSIFYDTMSDITVWANTLKREENIDGIKNIGWLNNHFNFELFKIGRMQYQFFKTNYAVSGVPLLKIRQLTVKNHRNALNIHIPEGEPLDFEECIKSLNSAKNFFAKYFPEYKFDGFVCDSWLLDPNNALFIDKTKNIVKFSELFDTVVRTRHNNFEIVRRLWGKKIHYASDIENFSENTNLQKRTKKYILSGGKTGNGYGTINILK